MMKYLFIFISFNFILFGAQVDESRNGIKFEKNYKSALKKAKEENKKVFIFISTSDCKFCDKLEKTTFADVKIYKRINKEYVSVHVTKDVDNYPSKLKAPATPMTYFLDNDEKVIDYSLGYWDSNDFKFTLDDVTRKYKKMRK